MNPLPAEADKRVVVEAMFDRIAGRYDLLNRLFTGGLDQRWRRVALDKIAVGPGDRVLDVACGTGDLTEQAAARGARCIGLDFAREMLRGAARRGASGLVRGDASRLPLADGAVNVVTCGFALRNFVDLEPALAEMARVLEPGGRLAILEVDRPDAAWVARAHSLYFDRVVPRVGGWLSDKAAYAYLPSSTVYLPPAPELHAMLGRVGFAAIERQRFLFGASQLLTARRRSVPA